MRTRKKGQHCPSMRVHNKHTSKHTNKIISGNVIKVMKLVNVNNSDRLLKSLFGDQLKKLA